MEFIIVGWCGGKILVGLVKVFKGGRYLVLEVGGGKVEIIYGGVGVYVVFRGL